MYTDLERPPLNGPSLRRALLADGQFWTDLRIVRQTESTNADAAASAREGTAEGLIVVAEQQVGGRGRLGRGWTSPERAGLTVSVLLRPEGIPAQRFGWLPLMAGVALTRAITRVAKVEAMLKWPNDLLLGPARRKAAGILAEVAAPEAVVIGIGLNVSTKVEELPRADATSLAIEGAATIDRDTVLRAILRELAGDYQVWREAGGDPDVSGLMSAFRESCDTLGRPVRVELPSSEPLIGTAVDIDPDGRLVVQPDVGGSVVAVAAGDVVHVRPEPGGTQ